MSSKPQKHNVTYNKKNLHGWGLRWWVTCSCGYTNGWHEKGDAKECYRKHKEENIHAEQPSI